MKDESVFPLIAVLTMLHEKLVHVVERLGLKGLKESENVVCVPNGTMHDKLTVMERPNSSGVGEVTLFSLGASLVGEHRPKCKGEFSWLSNHGLVVVPVR